MKKTDIGLIIGVVIVIVIALIVGNSNKNNDIELPLTLAGNFGVNEITYDEYEKYLEDEENILVIIIQTGCSHCENFLPVVQEVVGEYQIPVMTINITNLTQDEYTKLSQSNRYLKTQNWGTPTTLLLHGSTVVDSIGGEVDKDTFVEFIKENVKLPDTLASEE